MEKAVCSVSSLPVLWLFLTVNYTLLFPPDNAAGKPSAYMSAAMAAREKPIELKPGQSLIERYKIAAADELVKHEE